MGKKIKNAKLLKQAPKPNTPVSAFNSFATKVQRAKEKKIEKLSQTKDRLINQKRNNKVVRMPGNSKKVKKFALLDNDEDQPGGGLTHKGKSFGEIKHFNDMYFGSDEEGSHNDALHNAVNFEGF